VRRFALTSLALLILAAAAGMYALDFRRPYASTEWTRLAPYTEIDWDLPADNPYILVDGQWYELKAIAGIPIEEVQAVALREYQSWPLAEKRIAEDIYDVLTAMGVDNPTKVSMIVQRIESGEIVELSDVPMTAENRQRVYRSRYEPPAH
jgi:hypothetical protein